MTEISTAQALYIHVRCPQCQQPKGEPCINLKTNEIRKFPCIARINKATKASNESEQQETSPNHTNERKTA